MSRPAKGPVEKAVDADLRKLPVELRGSAVAATALAMARELDDSENSATSKSMCAGKLIDAVDKLRAMAPDGPQESKLDEIAKRREQRLARRAAS